MKERLSQLLQKPVLKVEKLFGDASYRTYHRGFFENGETFIVMALPEGKMSVSEEITNLKEPPKELPFMNIQRYLKSLQLPVPEIHLFSEEDRFLILEDLMDTKLSDLVEKAKARDRIGWVQFAIDQLITLQKKTTADLSERGFKSLQKECIAYQRSFDATLFNWEFDHFWEYYFQLSDTSRQPSAADEKLFQEETRRITKELCSLPQCFVHRDFQSRNLMYFEDKLYLIDFQDALLGPKTYDIVSLLRDSYIDLSSELNGLLSYYCGQSGEEMEKFKRGFDLQTIQRKLKDAGRFVYIDRVKKNPNFLKYIPTSLRYVKQASENVPEYRDLFQMLQRYVEEWR